MKDYTYLGSVLEVCGSGEIRIEQKNKFSVGEEVEIMDPSGENKKAVVLRIHDEQGAAMESAPHPKQTLYVALSAEASCYNVLRRCDRKQGLPGM